MCSCVQGICSCSASEGEAGGNKNLAGNHCKKHCSHWGVFVFACARAQLLPCNEIAWSESGVRRTCGEESGETEGVAEKDRCSACGIGGKKRQYWRSHIKEDGLHADQVR